MDMISPTGGPVHQAGTLSGNPLAMAAGLATIGYLEAHRKEIYPRLEATAKSVTEGVAEEAKKAGVPITLNRVGSMWTWFFSGRPVRSYDEAAKSDTVVLASFTGQCWKAEYGCPRRNLRRHFWVLRTEKTR